MPADHPSPVGGELDDETIRRAWATATAAASDVLYEPPIRVLRAFLAAIPSRVGDGDARETFDVEPLSDEERQGAIRAALGRASGRSVPSSVEEGSAPADRPSAEVSWTDQHGDHAHVLVGREQVQLYSPPTDDVLTDDVVAIISVRPSAGPHTFAVYVPRLAAQALLASLASQVSPPGGVQDTPAREEGRGQCVKHFRVVDNTGEMVCMSRGPEDPILRVERWDRWTPERAPHRLQRSTVTTSEWVDAPAPSDGREARERLWLIKWRPDDPGWQEADPFDEAAAALLPDSHPDARAIHVEVLSETDACEHDWGDARNEVVGSGEFCLKCKAVRAGNATTDDEDTPTEGGDGA